MKFRVGFVAALLFVGHFAVAQNGGVSVEVSLNQNQFLPAEDIEAAVKITNLSGQTLELGKDNAWLQFVVVEKGGESKVQQIGEVPVTGEFSLQSSLAGTKRVNLAPYFALRKPGTYLVKAILTIPQWNMTLSTAPKPFEVINGTVLKTIPFGVPPAPGDTDHPPEVRHYVLQQANYLKDNLSLYVRVTDENSNRTLKVVRAGPLTSFSKPEAQLDASSNLHLLFQSGARRFLYSITDPSGNVLVRQIHEIEGTRPKLRDAGEGRIVVAGGIRRPSEIDIPSAPNPALATE
jgi:hypothetical protein